MVVDSDMVVRLKRWVPRQGICRQCGRPFVRRGGNHVFCSERCAAEHRFGERVCVICGGSFIPKKATMRYCSRDCYLRAVKSPN